MVESVTTATAEMALKLSAVNRWCVTGTPISTGVQDLYGLLLFLGVSPFYYKSVSSCLINLARNPCCKNMKVQLHTAVN